eukprot:15237105-Heterocapsa_arctica.AAC.1
MVRVKANKEEAAADEGGGGDDVAMKATAEAEEERKAPGPKRTCAEVKRRSVPKGMTRRLAAPDGNCLFRSIGEAYGHAKDKKKAPSALT